MEELTACCGETTANPSCVSRENESEHVNCTCSSHNGVVTHDLIIPPCLRPLCEYLIYISLFLAYIYFLN